MRWSRGGAKIPVARRADTPCLNAPGVCALPRKRSGQNGPLRGARRARPWGRRSDLPLRPWVAPVAPQACPMDLADPKVDVAWVGTLVEPVA